MTKNNAANNHKAGTISDQSSSRQSLIPAYGRLMDKSAASAVANENVLGKVYFSPTSTHEEALPYPRVRIPVVQLQQEQLVEVWTSQAPVKQTTHENDIQTAANSDVLFGHVRRQLPLAGGPLESVVNEAYRSLLDLIDKLGYPHIVRIWNYIPGIGHNVDGLECYRRFCRARHLAFTDSRGDFVESLPAATAVGVQGEVLTLVFLATRRSGRQRENPRQVSAYRYPRLYGPRSPSFARATLVPWWGNGGLFVSGTGSIVGHESRHLGDPEKQLQEAVENVRVLVTGAIQDDGLPFNGFDSLSNLRVYLKNHEDYEMARACLEPLFGESARILYLQVDFCRSELLVELEGTLLPV